MKKDEKVNRMLTTLGFYANSDNYWSAALKLDEEYCKRTLRDVRKADKYNKVLMDRGAKARELLEILSTEEIEDEE